MEGGEFIFSRRAVQGIGASVLDNINRKFQAGGPVNPFTTGSNSNLPSFSRVSIDNSESIDRLIDEFRAMREDVAAYPRQIKAMNNLQEVNEGLNTLNNLQVENDI